MKTILGFEVEETEMTGAALASAANQSDADVIVTAVVLGFVGTRWRLGQPCRFDFEHPSPEDYEVWDKTNVGKRKMKPEKEKEFLKETQEFEHVMSAMSYLLGKIDSRLGAFLKDGQSREWSEGALITSRAGGQMLKADERHREIENEWSRIAANLAILLAKGGAIYSGKGAYTGVVDDPVAGNLLTQPTKRVIDPDTHRWRPGEGVLNWGLIRGPEGNEDINLSENREQGMGPLPGEVGDGARIGYIHGMSSAINMSVSSGPWCTPYELAAGDVTTKMASCFACCTYQYAAGFAPSSMHLGRGESWVPPAPHLVSGEHDQRAMPNYYNDQITKSLATRWHWDTYHYLRLGCSYLLKAIEIQQEEQEKLNRLKLNKTAVELVDSGYGEYPYDLKSQLDELWQRHLQGTADIGSEGGNLFLDALTVHDSDWKRIRRTLQPLYDHFDRTAAVRDILVN